MVHVILPASMKAAAGGKTAFDIEAANMQEVLARLGADHPQLKPLLERGVSVSINDVIYREPSFHPIPPDSEIYILPRMAGG
jgi:molybdopterin converting factor small subunit